jgi:CubicO group peptidase (beta-lactamase class C family)
MNKKNWQVIWRLAILLLLAIGVMHTGHPVAAKASLTGPTDPREVEAFIDPLMADLMAVNQAPGGAIAIVKDGQLLFAKGYGYADLERQIPVVADTTIFRAASVSKTLTWTAVMQLIEQGKLDLDTDVNSYLHGFQIPATYPQPITLRHLMTHTAGFEDQISNGKLYASEAAYRALPDFLAANVPARIFPPGEVVAYSNYGSALAGEIVAEVSGEPFETYIAHHILEPLAMARSSFQQPLPPEMAEAAATGYAAGDAGVPQAGPFELMLVRPAAALSSTVTDMAHFMIAHLQNGRYENVQILETTTAQTMHQQAYAFNSQLPGLTLGFAEYRRNGLRLLFHTGTTELSQSLLALMPEQNVGIYLALNSTGGVVRRLNLLNAVLDHYYPAPVPATEALPARIDLDAAPFAGRYILSRRAESNIDKLAAAIQVAVSVSVNADNTLSVSAFKDSQGEPLRWLAIKPLIFQEVGGQGLLAFSTDGNGRVTAMFNGDQPILIFQKVTWLTDPMNHLIGLLLALVVFVLTAVAWLIAAVWRLISRRPGQSQPFSRNAGILASGLILLNLVVIGLIIPALLSESEPESVLLFALPTGWLLAGTLVLISAAGALAVLLCTVRLWQRRAGSIGGRLHYTMVAVAALYFVWFFLQANFVIFRF